MAKPIGESVPKFEGVNSQEKDPMGMTKNDLKALVLHNGLAVLMDVNYPSSVDQSQRSGQSSFA